jgi:hypothetical protein
MVVAAPACRVILLEGLVEPLDLPASLGMVGPRVLGVAARDVEQVRPSRCGLNFMRPFFMMRSATRMP